MLTKTLGKSRFQIGGNVSNPDAADFTLCQSTMELLAGEGSETKRTDLLFISVNNGLCVSRIKK